jgi:hypothetical protein
MTLVVTSILLILGFINFSWPKDDVSNAENIQS